MKNLDVRYIDENEYDRWDEFVDISPQGNIFSKSYWLKAVSGNFRILVCEKNGEIVGGIALPYIFRSLFRMPKLSPQLGVLLPMRDGKAKYSTMLSGDIEIAEALIRSFPYFKLFDYNFSYDYTNYLPFIWSGFSIGVVYTYVIDDLSDPEEVYRNFQYDVKYTIRKAEKNGIKATADHSLADFYRLNKQTFDRKGIEIPYSFDFLARIDDALERHGNRRILFADDRDNNAVAAAYLVYDENCTYYLMSGADPKYRDTGAQTLLLWESIKFAAEVSGRFDFEGSSVRRIEEYFRGFGGTQKIIHRVYKCGRVMGLAVDAAKRNKNLIRKIVKV